MRSVTCKTSLSSSARETFSVYTEQLGADLSRKDDAACEMYTVALFNAPQATPCCSDADETRALNSDPPALRDALPAERACTASGRLFEAAACIWRFELSHIRFRRPDEGEQDSILYTGGRCTCEPRSCLAAAQGVTWPPRPSSPPGCPSSGAQRAVRHTSLIFVATDLAAV